MSEQPQIVINIIDAATGKRRKDTRTLVKQAKAIYRALEKERIRLHKNKDLEYSARTHIGKMIDRVDPLKIAGIFATAFVVKNLIQNTSSLLSKYTAWAFKPIWKKDIKPIWETQIKPIWEEIGYAPTVSIEGDPKLWITSFVIAYLIVEHGAQLLGGLSSLIGLISGFMS